ncbi:MAG TPA: lactate dehydrogenase [Lactobacillus sp.]|nr:lactate dehydrogenase [Lactobacillus sp.]
MTKIIMYSVRPDEMPAINAHAKREHLEIHTTKDGLSAGTVDQAQGFDGIVIQQRNRIDDDHVYQRLADMGLKQLTSRTAGFDMINVEAAHKAGLIVTNVPAYSPRSVAEHALMQIFRVLRKAPLVDSQVRANNYSWAGLQAKEIHSATIGIIGAGRIGGTLAKLLHALGATVLAYDVVQRDELKSIVTYVDKTTLLQKADVVSLHVDLNPTSKNLMTATDFAQMQPTAGIVNASRGPVINTDDLVDALETHQIAFAMLDTVTGEEKIFNSDHRQDGIDSQPNIAKLHAMSNVIITPHIAFFTNIAVQNMVDISLDDVQAILAGHATDHTVN